MSHTIQSSLDWAPIEATLLRQVSKLMYGRDLRAMIKNIQMNKKISPFILFSLSFLML